VRYSDWDHVRRVLAVRLDGVGAVVTLGPALRVLKGALPRAQLTLLASPSGSQVVPLLPWVDDLLVHDPVWNERADGAQPAPIDVGAQVDLIELVEGRRFDVAVVFTSRDRSPWPAAYVCYLAGVPLRIGQSAERGGGLLTHWVRPLPGDAHPVDRDLYLLESAGLPVAGRQLQLRVPEAARHRAAGLLARLKPAWEEPFAVLAPAAGGPYPAAAYAHVCRELVDRAGLPVVVVGGGADAWLADRVLAVGAGPQVASLAGQTSVPELAAVIERAELVVTASAATMHVADALRRPMVVLAAAREPLARWRPRATPARLLRLGTATDPPPAVVAGEAVTVLAAPARRQAPDRSGRLAVAPPEPPADERA
jgi:ADP-heptose:LPS heptosyltransferase